MEYVYREIKKTELPKVKKLFKIVADALEGRDYLRPFTQEIYDTFFDVAYNMGAFNGKELVGLGRLRTKERSGVDEYKKLVGIGEGCVAECSSYMVMPEHRGKGIMKAIQGKLFARAKELGFKYALASVHPENTPSKHVLEKYLKPTKTFTTKSGSIRTVYVAELR